MFPFWKKKEESRARFLHIAIGTKGVKDWCGENKVSLEDGYLRSFSKIKEVMRTQVEGGIPILSLLILHLQQEERKELFLVLKEFIEGDFLKNFLNEHKVRVSLLGKWYDLPSELIQPLKKLIEETRGYDQFFLNLCFNYDGQDELVDAFRIMAKQIVSGKLDPDFINRDTIKENLYTSYFAPPDMMVHSGEVRQDSFFLWDSVGAKLIYTEKDFPDFDTKWFDKLVKEG